MKNIALAILAVGMGGIACQYNDRAAGFFAIAAAIAVFIV